MTILPKRGVLVALTGPVGSIIYADLYGSIKIKFTVLIRDTDQLRSMRIYFDQF